MKPNEPKPDAKARIYAHSHEGQVVYAQFGAGTPEQRLMRALFSSDARWSKGFIGTQLHYYYRPRLSALEMDEATAQAAFTGLKRQLGIAPDSAQLEPVDGDKIEVSIAKNSFEKALMVGKAMFEAQSKGRG